MTAIQSAKTTQRKKQCAFILLPVILTLTILAAVSYLLSREGAINAGNVNREHEQDAALYVAQAGYNHAVWKLNRHNCTGFTDIPVTSIGSHSYLAAFTDTTGTALTAGSPANIKVTGTLANGTSYTILRNREKVYQYPITSVTLQLGTAAGKDAAIHSFFLFKNYNYGNYKQEVSSVSFATINQLIQFDLSTIPAEAEIISAQLELKQTATSSAEADAVISVHRIMQSWGEGTKSGSEPADGATWNTTDGSLNWDGGGGSYDATAIASIVITSALVIRNWDISSLVQNWHNGLYVNEGVLLKGSGTVYVSFASKEDVTVANRPKLSISYRCECGVSCTTKSLLLVVVDPTSLTAQETDKKTLFESWSYTVTLIDMDDSQSAFDAALASNDVVFITEEIDSTRLNTKLVNATIGVVTEEDNLSDEFGMASTITWDSGDTLNITDNSHYITQPFSLGNLTVMTAVNSLAYVSGTRSIDLKNLGSIISRPALVALDVGATTYTAGTVAGRRVQLPWGGNSFDVNTLTADGLTILQRALEWGAEVVTSPSLSTGCNGTFRDEFNDIVYSGNNGTFNWLGDWQEINESDGPTRGDERVFADLYEVPDMPTNQLFVRDNDGGGEGVMRALDLSNATTATLSFDYKPAGLDNSNDYASVQMSSTGVTGPWTEVVRFAGPANETAYQLFSTDISSYLSADAVLRIITSPNMGGADYLFLDNIQIECSK